MSIAVICPRCQTHFAITADLADEQVRIFVRGHRIMLPIGAAHYDVIVLAAAVEKGGGGLARPIGREFFVAMEGDDADGLPIGGFQPEDIEEEAADLLEVADQVTAGACAGGGEELEIGGADSHPGVGGSGRECHHGSQGPGQRQKARGPDHEDECITGSAEPSSMAAISS